EQGRRPVAGTAWPQHGIVALCPGAFTFPAFPSRASCPRVVSEHHRGGGAGGSREKFVDEGLGFAQTLFGVLVHELVHLYNPLDDGVEGEVYTVQGCAELGRKKSLGNAANWHYFASDDAPVGSSLEDDPKRTAMAMTDGAETGSAARDVDGGLEEERESCLYDDMVAEHTLLHALGVFGSTGVELITAKNAEGGGPAYHRPGLDLPSPSVTAAPRRYNKRRIPSSRAVWIMYGVASCSSSSGLVDSILLGNVPLPGVFDRPSADWTKTPACPLISDNTAWLEIDQRTS
ncbi:MAG: hypothetical protein Q9173_007054, partial [Seirophora scorigena]